MDGRQALLIQNSLSVGSKQRLVQYCKDLKRDGNEDIFDAQVLRLLRRYVYSPRMLESVRQELNRSGYNQSTKEYSQIVNQLERFVTCDYTSFRWNRNYQEAKAILKRELSKASLLPLCYSNDQDIVDAIPKKTTHSGWTYLISGNKYKGDNLEAIFSKYEETRHQAIIDGDFNTPILIGVRTQCSNIFDDNGERVLDEFGNPQSPKHKTRMVSMIDLMQIICELRWAKPLQQYLGQSVQWYAGGKNETTLREMISDYRARYVRWISLDYSKYDQSLSSWLIEDTFEILESAFQDLVDVPLWNAVKRSFIHKVFIDGDGKVWESHKGVPSGSMFTQIIDSVANMLMILTFMVSKGKTLASFRSLIMGDDNLVFVHSFSKDEICSYLTKNFGIEVNASKSSDGLCNADPPEFLSRVWTNEGPYRHPKVLISKLLFPERFRNYAGDVSPEMVLYSYILAYGAGMKEFINVDRFLMENDCSWKKYFEKGREYLPGWLGYAYSYGLIRST